jgi:FKBP-type peptidyl-prolyl cis-trans isomerase
LWTTGGKLHITGTKLNQTDGEDDDHSHCHGNEEESDGDEEASHNDDSESIASREPVSTISSSEKSNKRPRPEVKTVIGTTAIATKEQHPIHDKIASIQQTNQERKKWKVKPQNDEGVLVPEPRAQKKTSGVSITDFIIGRGAQPKLGAKVNITYEGSFPDGTVFDKCITRARPFSFRMGTAQVIRGLDLGLEGMRIGGSREILIPPTLG